MVKIKTSIFYSGILFNQLSSKPPVQLLERVYSSILPKKYFYLMPGDWRLELELTNLEVAGSNLVAYLDVSKLVVLFLQFVLS